MKKAKEVPEGTPAVALAVPGRLLWLGAALRDCIELAEDDGSALIVCAIAADDSEIMVKGQCDGSQTLMVAEMMLRAVRDSAEAQDDQTVACRLAAPLASLQAAMEALGVPQGRQKVEARDVN